MRGYVVYDAWPPRTVYVFGGRTPNAVRAK